MTHFEKIKEHIAAASVEEMADILVANDVLFICPFCEVYDAHCDRKCEQHCLSWLNSQVPDE